MYVQNTFGRIIKKRLTYYVKEKNARKLWGKSSILYGETYNTYCLCVRRGGFSLVRTFVFCLNIYLRTRPKSLISDRLNGYFAMKRMRVIVNKFKINDFTGLNVFCRSVETRNACNCFEEKDGRIFYA